MIKKYLKTLSEAYYQGSPIISDAEYDALERIHGQLIGGTGDIPHAYRMYSLKKHYSKDGTPPLSASLCTETLKLDGAAVDVIYVNCELQLMLTRGDGIVGRDITSKAKILGIPERVDKQGIVQVTGEVVASKHMENSRNYASGALGQKDLELFESRVSEGKMNFIAYGIQAAENRHGIFDTYLEDMEFLQNSGFHTILDGDYWADFYPTDGIVYRLTSNAEFNFAGFTDKFPRGAYAYKEEQEHVETTLLEVEWQTGKSGKVTPVAILEEVMIGDAKVARATLNNIAYIEALELEIGCRVKVIRSGEIIPKIIGKVND